MMTWPLRTLHRCVKAYLSHEWVADLLVGCKQGLCAGWPLTLFYRLLEELAKDVFSVVAGA